MFKSIGAFSSYSAWWSYITLSLQKTVETSPYSDLYDVLEAYYLNNGLYEVIDTVVRRNRRYNADGTPTVEDIQPLRNPAYRVVEFYASKIWGGSLPDALPIETENEAIIDPINQIWQWSNWNSAKQECARWFATYGDMFIKVATNSDGESQPTRVYLQNIKPKFVTDFDADERGYLQWIRIDLPQVKRDESTGEVESYTRTEVWAKDGYRVWEHKKGAADPLNQLGTAIIERPLSDFQIDFVPIVWQPFKSIGDERGVGAFTLQLDKIDEADRQATRLHQLLFRHNKPLWASVRTDKDPSGRPLPPVRIGDNNQVQVDNDTEEIINLPGSSDLKSLIPSVNYADALNILNDQMAELEKDLPELAYYRLRDMGDISGRAVRLLLGDAIDRAIEARGNAEAGLIRAQQMALTVGANAGLFSGIGTYEAGNFDHSFRKRPVVKLPESEEATLIKEYRAAEVPLITAVRRAGWTQEQIDEMIKDKRKEETENQKNFAKAQLDARRSFDRGETGNEQTQPSVEDTDNPDIDADSQ